MNRRSILAAYKKKSSHLQTGVTGFKSGNLFTKLLTCKKMAYTGAYNNSVRALFCSCERVARDAVKIKSAV